MNKNDVLNKVQEIANDVLERNDVSLHFETTTDMVDGWDSLNHVQIISEIQDFYNIKFSAREMISWDNIGDMCDSIINRIN